ncbi:unnamed protein product [Miscanthus lutarioriparius]|uniref:Uncharacterized protein n=1 Tax=Miscanthus lutarioriparius TaxID=422564 RepID=A0A811N587_9POAL|nr:unnamed protein product [Miscanthus lutarioriparius]
MTTKDSTLIIEVDLQCEKCYKKIRKVLCKLQSKENIKKIDYENTKNKVTVVGAFDPKKLSKILRCKACDVIKDITIVKPPEEKKTEEKKPEDKKPEEKKKPAEEKKPTEDKKKPAEEKKPTEEKKGEEKAKPAAAPPSTTVNLQFANICVICYPWPCNDPAHWGGFHHQHQLPQWPPCGGMAPAPAPPVHNHPQPPCGGGPQKWAQCGGPPFCGGCAWCHGGGGGMNCWAPAQPQPQPMCCPGPSLCRGCNGCKIVRETKFSYEEYPSSACAIM